MAKVKIQGNASGTGILTVTAPDTDENRTITLPDETATLSTFDPDGAVVINDTGADVDFRVESDDNANMIKVDAGNDRVGIGVAAPASLLHAQLPSTATASIFTFDRSDEAVRGEIKYDDTAATRGFVLGSTTQHSFAFKTDDTTRLRLTYDGRGLSQFTAKAWINMNGTGTIAIRDSHNVSSISDGSTGIHTINFSNNMDNTNYCVSTGAKTDAVSMREFGVYSYSVGSLTGACTFENNGAADAEYTNVIVFGD